MGNPKCRRCKGVGSYLVSRDMHRSEGWVSCGCPERFCQPAAPIVYDQPEPFAYESVLTEQPHD